MAQRTTPPFRADHVGSLLRPQRLMEAREARKAGRIDDQELKGIEDEAIRDVVRMQEDVGLQYFTPAALHIDVPGGTNRSGSKPPERASSHSMKKPTAQEVWG